MDEADNPYDAFNARVDAENARPGREFVTATDDCVHCGRRLLFDPANEVFTAKGNDGYDCSVKGSFAHEPEA